MSLFLGLVLIPAWWLLPHWAAQSLGLGVVAGYLAYGFVHHAVHHWRAPAAWLLHRKRWHAHHHHVDGAACFGVSTAFWDRRFRTIPTR